MTQGPAAADQSGKARCPLQVYVRIRPLLDAESGERVAWHATSECTLACLEESTSATAGGPGAAQHGINSRTASSGLLSGSSAPLFYNRVFNDVSSSEDVYREAAHPIVLAGMQGYNGTIFAYGQTGSGKTHTMRSVMRQAAAEIFSYIKSQPGREYVLRMSSMEIYNEEIKDLMREGAAPRPIKVMEDSSGGTHVEGLVEEGLRSQEHLQELLQTVEARRHVRDTRANASSSRSHQIVRVYIESRPARSATDAQLLHMDQDSVKASPPNPYRHTVSGGGNAVAAIAALSPVTLSVLNFVDLAGSERQAQAAGEDVDQEKLRQKEASNINMSLLCLGKVMRALAECNKHVPYRDAKLTRILQPSLSGNSHMAIVCTISPTAGSVENTRAALHFATTAKKVVMRPQVNEVVDDKAVIRRMQEEIMALKRQLAQQPCPVPPTEDLSAVLEAKEEQVRRAAQEKEGLQRRLAGLERLILRSDGLVKERRSFDGSVDLAVLGFRCYMETPEGALVGVAADGVPGGAAGLSSRRGAMWASGTGPAEVMRASWNPGSATPGSGSGPGASSRRGGLWRQGKGGAGETSGVSGASMFRSPGQLLDLRLTPSVRRAVQRVSEAGGSASPSAAESTAMSRLTREESEDGDAAAEADEAVEVVEGALEDGQVFVGVAGVKAEGGVKGSKEMQAGQEEAVGDRAVRSEDDDEDDLFFGVHLPPYQVPVGSKGSLGDVPGADMAAKAAPTTAEVLPVVQDATAGSGVVPEVGQAGAPRKGESSPPAGATVVPKLDFKRLQLSSGTAGVQPAAAATVMRQPTPNSHPLRDVGSVETLGHPSLRLSSNWNHRLGSVAVTAAADDAQSLKMETVLAALQAELRCIKDSCGQLSDIHGAVHSLAEEVRRMEESAATGGAGTSRTAAGGAGEEGSVADQKKDAGGASAQSGAGRGAKRAREQRLIAALKVEVSRLQQAAEAGSKADVALGALQKRLQVPSVVDDELLEAEVQATTNSLPGWLQQVLAAGEEHVQQESVEAGPHPEGASARADVGAVVGALGATQDVPAGRRYTQTDSCCSSRSARSVSVRPEGLTQSHQSAAGGSVVDSAEVLGGPSGTAPSPLTGVAAGGRQEVDEGAGETQASGLGWCPAPGVSVTPFKLLAGAQEGGRGSSVPRSASASRSLGGSVDKGVAGRGSGRSSMHGAEGLAAETVLGSMGSEVGGLVGSGHVQPGAEVAPQRGGSSIGASSSVSLPPLAVGLPPGGRTPSAKPRPATGSGVNLRPAPSASAASCASVSGLSGGSPGLKASSSASLGGLDLSRVKGAVTSQKEAVKEWYKAELQRLHAEFTANAGREVAELSEALEQMREHQERLELQKRLLLNQVLQLESELDAALSEVKRLNVTEYDDADWGRLTPRRLLPNIFKMWEQLHVPLVYRSRFYLYSKDRDSDDRLLFFRIETQKLELRKRKINKNGPSSTNGRSAFEERAAQALDWERKNLAAALKRRYSEEQRERLFEGWGVNVNTKGRKLQLMRSLWNPCTTLRRSDMDGALHSALLVLALSDEGDGGGANSKDAGGAGQERFEEVVLGSHDAGNGSRPSSHLSLAVTNFVKLVATPRSYSKRPPLAPTSSMSGATTGAGGSVMGGGGPAHSTASTSDGPAATPRQSSWISRSLLSGRR